MYVLGTLSTNGTRIADGRYLFRRSTRASILFAFRWSNGSGRCVTQALFMPLNLRLCSRVFVEGGIICSWMWYSDAGICSGGWHVGDWVVMGSSVLALMVGGDLWLDWEEGLLLYDGWLSRVWCQGLLCCVLPWAWWRKSEWHFKVAYWNYIFKRQR